MQVRTCTDVCVCMCAKPILSYVPIFVSYPLSLSPNINVRRAVFKGGGGGAGGECHPSL